MRPMLRSPMHSSHGKLLDVSAEGDEYSCALLDTHLEIWTDGAGDNDHTNGFFSADTSFVCIDNDDTGGIDVFISQYGQTSVPAKLWLSMPPLPPPAGRQSLSSLAMILPYMHLLCKTLRAKHGRWHGALSKNAVQYKFQTLLKLSGLAALNSALLDEGLPCVRLLEAAMHIEVLLCSRAQLSNSW